MVGSSTLASASTASTVVPASGSPLNPMNPPEGSCCAISQLTAASIPDSATGLADAAGTGVDCAITDATDGPSNARASIKMAMTRVMPVVNERKIPLV